MAADNTEKDKKDNSFMMKLATLIVDKRKGFYLIFIVLCIFCVLSMNKVKVNNDLTTYLPDTTETRKGLDLMDSEFTTYGSARILICNVTFDEAQKLADQVEKMDGVSMLDFDDTEDHYHDMEALLSVTFDEEADTEATQQHLTEVLDALSDYDVYYSSDIGQEERDADDLNNDMIVILLLAAVVIVAVLLFTSTTYAEIPVYLTTFIVAAILNKGTNYWFGTISFVTNSIAVVLQLGLAVDYAIILAHRFMEEHEDKDAREAVIVALSKAIPEISSSSLTTISGMVAMMFMQFRIGYDMGIILAKSIIFSMVAVFFLMPGLLLTIIFKYLPMGGLLIAFEDYNVIKGVLGSPWVGLEYFRRFLSSPDFMSYLMNTLKLSIYGLLWGFPVPIILALLLNRIQKTGIKKKVQLLIYMPNFISVIVLCGMVRMFLSPVGPLNKVLGISTNWMTMPSAFRTIYIASGIWQAAGWASIMYTAALSNASKELEEAALMDGANLLQQIWYVELPAIKNIIVIQFILQAGNIMSIGFEKAYALQTDMNLPASEILSTYVYRIGLLNGDYGYSTAVGLFNSVVNVILLVFVNWVVQKLNDGEGL